MGWADSAVGLAWGSRSFGSGLGYPEEPESGSQEFRLSWIVPLLLAGALCSVESKIGCFLDFVCLRKALTLIQKTGDSFFDKCSGHF